MIRVLRNAAAAALAAMLAACSAVPPSLAPEVRKSAVDYGNVMDRFADRALLANVLRARDYLPLNFSDLSSISGSLNVQSSLDLDFPLQNFPSSLGLGSGSLGMTASSSPVLTLGSLDSQGFITSMIQPVSPMYVVSKWNDGYDRETLMFLFIKSIRFADGTSYFNNPDDPAEMARFDRLVAEMIAAHVRLKPLALLDPIGPTFALASVPHAHPAPDPSLPALSTIKSIAGGRLRVGNAACTVADESDCVQLYKAYPAQVALCVDAQFDAAGNYKFNDHVIFGAAETSLSGTPHGAAGRALMRAQIKAAGAHGASVLSSSAAGDDDAMADVTASLQPNRISVILGNEDCRPDEIVLARQTEENLSAASGEFAEVEWRSISEVIQYLGAVVRNEGTPHVPLWRDSDSGTPQTLIDVVPGGGGLITVDYRGSDYSVPGERRDRRRYPRDIATTHGLQALAILNELIGTAKISGNVPMPQPVQFVVP